MVTLKYCCINHAMETKCCFQFEIIINVLLSYFRFIQILMLCVYGHYKFYNSFSARAVFGRQILTSKDGPRAERVNIQIVLNIILVMCPMPEYYICLSCVCMPHL